MTKKGVNGLYSGQRVGVFVDVQNLYYSAKFIYKNKVNFLAILEEAIRGRNLIRAIAYVIKTDVKEETNFFEALKHLGYEVRAKDLQVFYGGAKKGDWDIGIAMDTIELAPRLDVIVLVSGDGDFTPCGDHGFWEVELGQVDRGSRCIYRFGCGCPKIFDWGVIRETHPLFMADHSGMFFLKRFFSFCGS